jgi:hypothetical protein
MKLPILTLAALFMSSYAAHAEKNQTKSIVGYLEKIVVQHIDKEFEAKLDTGADTTSIHADVIELKKKSKKAGEEGYVVFTIGNSEDTSKHIKKPLVRIVKIIERTGGYIKRPVVEMTFCIAGKLVTEEVNLANRDRFNYDVLIGRNMLEHAGLVVDSGTTYTTKPNCPEPENAKPSPDDDDED